MARLTLLVLEQLSAVLFLCVSFTGAHFCRTVPGDPSFPSDEEWNSLNSSVSGRLVKAVPSAQLCNMHGGCTDAEWTSVFSRRYTWSHESGAIIIYRQTTPLTILMFWQVNWEQVNF